MKSRSMSRGARVAAFLGLIWGLFALAPVGWAQDAGAPEDDAAPAVDLNPGQAEAALKIKSQVMAPCCWNGTVDTHLSAISMKISGQIDYWVSRGMTRDEILNRLAKQYGERILAQPRSEGLGLVFWLGPVAAGGVGFFFVRRWIARHSGGAIGEVAMAAGRETAGGGSSSPAGAAESDDAWNTRFEQQLKSLD